MKYTTRKKSFFDKEAKVTREYTECVVYTTIDDVAIVGVISPLFEKGQFAKKALQNGAGTADLHYVVSNTQDGDVKESAYVTFANGDELAVKVTFDGINILKLIEKTNA